MESHEGDRPNVCERWSGFLLGFWHEQGRSAIELRLIVLDEKKDSIRAMVTVEMV
jgi:hypothetical protein